MRSRCFSPPLSESNSPSVPYVVALKMAEGREPGYLSPLEEQFIQESETDEDIDQQLLREREMAAHRLWASFQDSAMAVSHLFRDCQQQAGLSAWVPFHESASAVTQLYRGASEVCRQCMDSGTRYGQRKRTKEIISWAKKKRKHIRREELLAFLLDKPCIDSSSLTSANTAANSPISSPRRRPLLRDDPPPWSSDGDIYGISNNSNREGTTAGRKRTASSSGSNIFDFNVLGSECKRMKF